MYFCAAGRDSLGCVSLTQWRPARLPTIPEPPAISLIITDRNQMDSGSHADYRAKSFLYQESECQLNQNLSRQIKGPAAFPLLLPKALFRHFLPGLSRGSGCCGSVWPHLGASIHVLLSSERQPITSVWRAAGWEGVRWAGGKKQQNKLIDCKPSYDVSMN